MDERLPSINELHLVQVHRQKPVLTESGEFALMFRDHPTEVRSGHADETLILKTEQDLRLRRPPLRDPVGPLLLEE